MSSQRVSEPYKTITRICNTEGFETDNIYNLVLSFFKTHKRLRWAKKVNPISDRTSEPVQCEELRQEFRVAMSTDDRKVHESFIWKLFSSGWDDTQIQIVLDEISDFQDVGKTYRKIITEAFLSEDNVSGKELYKECQLGKTAFFNKRKEALCLFGITMWLYVRDKNKVESLGA